MNNNKKSNTKSDAATDITEIKQLLSEIAKYLCFIRDCEAIRHGIEIK